MVTFIILHYKNTKDTLECLESIKKLENQEKIKIIVVDNHTLNKKEKEKLERYTKDILLLEENLGFAKANNKGCTYAKEKYNPDFYVVLNNDTVILQKDFIKRVEQDYKKYKFDMLGPWIETDNGDSVNPFPVLENQQIVKAEIKKANQLIKIYNRASLTFLLNSYMRIKHMIKKPKKLANSSVVEKEVALHGCFMIFSKKYVEKYKLPFYNDTFLYHEEEFLYHRMKHDKLVSLYDPDIKIYHKEGASLNYQFNKSIREKKKVSRKTRLESLKKLEQYMEDES